MRESVLAKYFSGEVPPSILVEDLANVRGTKILKKDYNLFCDLKDCRNINFDDLIKLGNDYLNGFLQAKDIEAVSFFLMGSDHFEWDSETQCGAVVAEVIDDWSSPETAYPINQKNMKMIVRGLGEGVYDKYQLEANRE